MMRRIAEDAWDEQEVDEGWSPTWLPLTENVGGGMLVADLAGSTPTTPIRYVDYNWRSELPIPVLAESLRTVVLWWVELYDRETYRPHGETGTWEMAPVSPDLLPGPEWAQGAFGW